MYTFSLGIPVWLWPSFPLLLFFSAVRNLRSTANYPVLLCQLLIISVNSQMLHTYMHVQIFDYSVNKIKSPCSSSVNLTVEACITKLSQAKRQACCSVAYPHLNLIGFIWYYIPVKYISALWLLCVQQKTAMGAIFSKVSILQHKVN